MMEILSPVSSSFPGLKTGNLLELKTISENPPTDLEGKHHGTVSLELGPIRPIDEAESLPGLGGKELSKEHATGTAGVLNKIDPQSPTRVNTIRNSHEATTLVDNLRSFV
jgi:hypothetical protein